MLDEEDDTGEEEYARKRAGGQQYEDDYDEDEEDDTGEEEYARKRVSGTKDELDKEDDTGEEALAQKKSFLQNLREKIAGPKQKSLDDVSSFLDDAADSVRELTNHLKPKLYKKDSRDIKYIGSKNLNLIDVLQPMKEDGWEFKMVPTKQEGGRKVISVMVKGKARASITLEKLEGKKKRIIVRFNYRFNR